MKQKSSKHPRKQFNVGRKYHRAIFSATQFICENLEPRRLLNGVQIQQIPTTQVVVQQPITNVSLTNNSVGNISASTLAVNPINPGNMFVAYSNQDGYIKGQYTTNGGKNANNWAPSNFNMGNWESYNDPFPVFDKTGRIFMVDMAFRTEGQGDARKYYYEVQLLESVNQGKDFNIVDDGQIAYYNVKDNYADHPSIAVGPGPNGQGGILRGRESLISKTPDPMLFGTILASSSYNDFSSPAAIVIP